MLAVHQRPQVMASERLLTDPDPAMAFGYPIDDFPFQSAPDPPPGAPLLSDNEQKALNLFFEDMTSDAPLYSAGTPSGLMYSEGWMDLPPQFMGSTSFYGHHPDPLQSSPTASDFMHQVFPDMAVSHSLAMPPPPPPPQQQQQQQAPQQQQQQQQTVTVSAPTPVSMAAHHSPISPSAPPSATMVHPTVLRRASAIDIPPHPSAEVLEAATVLQNGPLVRSNSLHHFGSMPTLVQHHDAGLVVAAARRPSSASSTASPTSVNAPLLHDPSQPGAMGILQSHSPKRRAPSVPVLQSPLGEHDSTFHDMMFGKASFDQRHARTALSTALRWGSDDSFNHVQFTPLSEKETSEALLETHMKHMECLEVSRSANTTRPSSPIYNVEMNPLKLKTRTASMAATFDKNGPINGHLDVPPRKRRRGVKGRKDDGSDFLNGFDDEMYGDNESALIDDDDTMGAYNGATLPKPRKRKSRTSVTGNIFPLSPSSPQQPTMPGSDGSVETPARRRRSTAIQAKQPRENLSEEQKRENHIKSEQKRRTLIKEGFDDLCTIIPSLHGGGFSKSVMLSMAADWLEDLLRGNDRLREQIRML